MKQACLIHAMRHTMTRQTKRYTISKSDYKVIMQFSQVLELVGYNRTIINYIEGELKRDFSTNSELFPCQRCGKKKHKVLMKYSLKQIPSNRRVCVECFGVDKLASFTPRMTMDQAWLRVTA